MFPWRKGNSPTRGGFREERKEREGSFLIIKNIIGIIKYTIIIFLIFYIVVDRFATLLIFSNLLSTFERSFPLIIILSSPKSEMDRIKSDPRTAAFRPTSRSSSVTKGIGNLRTPHVSPSPIDKFQRTVGMSLSGNEDFQIRSSLKFPAVPRLVYPLRIRGPIEPGYHPLLSIITRDTKTFISVAEFHFQILLHSSLFLSNNSSSTVD